MRTQRTIGFFVMVVVGAGCVAIRPDAAVAQATGRIVVVDLDKIAARSAAGVAFREQLERQKATMLKEIQTREGELVKLKDELDKKGPLLTADARREKQDAFDRKNREATRLAEDYRRELQKKEQELAVRMLQDLSGIIERLGKEKKLSVILAKRAVLYSAPEADITDEIIRAYDQESAKKK